MERHFRKTETEKEREDLEFKKKIKKNAG